MGTGEKPAIYCIIHLDSATVRAQGATSILEPYGRSRGNQWDLSLSPNWERPEQAVRPHRIPTRTQGGFRPSLSKNEAEAQPELTSVL